MNRKMIVKELDTWAKKELGSTYVVTENERCLDLCRYRYGSSRDIAWFSNFLSDEFDFTGGTCDNEYNVDLIQNDVVHKFYDKAVELLTKYESKYTIQITKDKNNYLHANKLKDYKDVYFDVLVSSSVWVNEFTQSQIEEFKKRDDLAIDWDKAIIKKVDENE